MSYKFKNRSYKLKDAALIQKADSILQSANDDIAQLATFGITPAWLDTVKGQRNEFSDFTTEYEDKSNIDITVSTKREIRKELQQLVIANNKRLKNKMHQCMAAYQKGFIENPSRLDDMQLRREALAQARALQHYLAELASEGVTQSSIDSLKAQSELFMDALIETDIVRGDRVINTEKRIEKGNTLYKSLKKISLFGLSAFRNAHAHAKPYYLNPDAEPKTFSITLFIKKAESAEIRFGNVPAKTPMTLSHMGGDVIRCRFGNAAIWELKSKNRFLKTVQEWGYNQAENNILWIENINTKRPCRIRLRLPKEFKENITSLYRG